MDSASFTSQSSKQIGHRGVPIQCSGSGAGAVVKVAAAVAALARATSAQPREGPSTTGGAAFGFDDGGGVDASSRGALPLAAAAAFALTRRLHSFLWPRSFQSTVWHAMEQYGVLHFTHLSFSAGWAQTTHRGTVDFSGWASIVFVIREGLLHDKP